jgi:hypothetical protein
MNPLAEFKIDLVFQNGKLQLVLHEKLGPLDLPSQTIDVGLDVARKLLGEGAAGIAALFHGGK